ncbi:MAG: hypothetical protein ACLFN8_00320 [Candidatus Woesearchaeota archaeon]
MIIQNYFMKLKSKRTLKRVMSKTKPFFLSSEGRDTLLKQVFLSEFPLYVSEPVFGLKDELISHLDIWTYDRLNILRDVIENGKLSKKKYFEAINSADVNIEHEQDLIVHTHPMSIKQTYLNDILAAEFNYSKKDIIFSMTRPIGLLEYAVLNSSNESIILSTRLSVCHLMHAQDFLITNYLLRPDGTYISKGNNFFYEGAVPKIGHVSENIACEFKNYVGTTQTHKLTRLINYTIRHSFEKVRGHFPTLKG